MQKRYHWSNQKRKTVSGTIQKRYNWSGEVVRKWMERNEGGEVVRRRIERKEGEMQ
jgi:hypothetical protein